MKQLSFRRSSRLGLHYIFTLRADGSVTFEGIAGMRKNAPASFHVDPAQMTTLLQLLEQLKNEPVDEMYRVEEPGEYLNKLTVELEDGTTIQTDENVSALEYPLLKKDDYDSRVNNVRFINLKPADDQARSVLRKLIAIGQELDSLFNTRALVLVKMEITTNLNTISGDVSAFIAASSDRRFKNLSWTGSTEPTLLGSLRFDLDYVKVLETAPDIVVLDFWVNCIEQVSHFASGNFEQRCEIYATSGTGSSSLLFTLEANDPGTCELSIAFHQNGKTEPVVYVADAPSFLNRMLSEAESAFEFMQWTYKHAEFSRFISKEVYEKSLEKTKLIPDIKIGMYHKWG